MSTRPVTAVANGQASGKFNTETAMFVAVLAFRLVNLSYMQTFFQPDEYFQALEPAWELAFGPNSGAWITWEWRERLRTSVHPFLFAVVYRFTDGICRFAQIAGPTRANALLAAPGLFQAFGAAILDQMTWKAAFKLYGHHPATFATAFLTLLSPWQWYCSTRTFSNSLEATITAIALYFFPWRWFLRPEKDDKTTISLTTLTTNITLDNLDWAYFKRVFATTPSGLYPSLTAAAIAFYLRPTNVIVWAAISFAILGSNRNYRKAFVLLQCAAIIGVFTTTALSIIDRVYYGEATFPPFRFVYFNVVQSLAVFYGSNRVDYYVTEGLPLLLTTALPFAIVAIWQSLQSAQVQSTEEYIERQTRFVFAFAIVATILVLSAIGHKEVRFMYPLLPMLHVLAGKTLAPVFDPFPYPRSKARQLILAFIVATNVYIAGYVGTTHQRGVMDVMHYLRHQQEISLDAIPCPGDDTFRQASNITVGFLMPCHSTPWRSHFVYPEIDAWALTCEPPVNIAPDERASYLDEADVFYADPAAWMLQNMENVQTISASADLKGWYDNQKKGKEVGRRPWPNYLVFFEHLESTVKAELAHSRYSECTRFFNTHWHDDGRRRGDVVVWCLPR